MRTVSYKSVLDGVLSARGITPASAQRETVARVAGFVADRLLTAWEYYRWPEAMECDLRRFRAEWKAQTYPVDAEVWHEESAAYYRAIAPAAGADAPGVSDAWAPLLEYRRCVEYDQPGKPHIEAVLGAWTRDPYATDDALPVDFKLTAGGVIVGGGVNGVLGGVWLEYRRRADDFNWEVGWINVEAFPLAAGTHVHHAGEVWEALDAAGQEDEPGKSAKWRKLDFPYFLARAVKAGAAADELAAGGQDEKKRPQEATFEDLLDEQVWQITKLQGQTGRPQVIPNR